jgi:uncharacterized repeat protein (TIGR01451 family)
VCLGVVDESESQMQTHRVNRRRVAGAILAFLGTIQVMAGVLAPVPAAAAPVSGGTLLDFEADGDHDVDTEDGLDWAEVDPVIAYDPLVANGGKNWDLGFQGSSDENDPTDFTCQAKENAITPEKDNLLRAYVHPDIDEDQGLLALGFVRADGGTQGDTHVNFEFNRNDIDFNPVLNGACPYAVRAAGDLLFTFDFPGNSVDPAQISVYSWDPTVGPVATDKGEDGNWVELVLSDASAFAVAKDNSETIPDEVIGGGTQIAQRAFGEVVLDLVELDAQVREEYGDDAAILTCPGFGSASVRSRASGQSFSSSLQDFIGPVGVDVSTCGSLKIKKVDDLGNPMEGVGFDLYDNADGTGDPVDSCPSIADGTCTFSDVTPGDYWVFEDATTVPAGYTAATNPVAGPITIGFKEDVDLTDDEEEWIVNPRQTGYVEITKVLAELDPEGGDDIAVVPDDIEDLAGATFRLYQDTIAADGEYEAGEEVTFWGTTTVAECTIASGEDSCVIGPVGTGDYRVTETVVPAETSKGPDVAVTVTAAHTTQAPAQVTYTNYVSPLQIELDKTGPGTANLGDTFTYTFDVTTTGPPLTDVELVELDTERCNVEAAPLSGPTKTGGNQDEWLEDGETWTWTCDHLVTASDPDPLPNKAEVTGTDRFGREVDDDDTHLVDILYPDVTVAKDAVDDTITAGDEIAFDLTVTNNGDGIARSVTLSDDLPPGIVWSEDSDDCSIDTSGDPDVLECSFGDLAAKASTDTVRISGTVDTGECGTVDNTAVVSATNERLADQANNSDSDSVDVSCPDVSITKTGNGTINAGDDAEFTITVTNNDQTGTATGVTVSDTLPAGITWTEDHADCSIAAGVLSCDFGDLAPGASESVTLTGATVPADCGLVPNTATVSSTNEDPTLGGNNEASDTITVECPDVTIEKTPDDAVINAGDQASFTIVVGNDGPGTAYDVSVSDELPGDIDWAIDPAVTGCSITDGTLDCDLGDLADGDSVSITITGTTEPADCGVLDNTAFADASNDDQVSDDGRITVECPDIDITKVADDDVVSAGTDVGFTITVWNDGPGTAYDVTVEDELPSGLDWTIDPAVDGCAITDGVLACDLGDLEDGDQVVIHLSAPTDESQCGSYDNLAMVDASNDDPADDQDSVAVLCPGLNITKSADDVLVDAGDEIGFSIVVSNVDDGVDPAEGTATDVTVTDELPEGFDWSLDPAVDGCTITDGVLECELGDLEPGDSVTIHLVATAEIDDCGTISNVAVADAGNAPAVDDDADVDVLCPLDIEVDKSGPAAAHVGDEITYTFDVTNTGEADLVSVELSDPLCDDESLTLVDDGDGDTVLAVDEVWTYTCTHVVTDDDPDPLPNTATVVGEDDRGRTTDDTDDHEVDILHPEIEIVKTVDESGPSPGDTITFSYEVTNTGDTTLYDVEVVDDQLGAVGTIDELAPGEVVVLTKDDVVQADQSLINVGTASGTDVLGEVVNDSDDEVITIVLPSQVVRTPEVLPDVLARTGTAIGALLVLAGAALLSGGSLAGIGRRLRRREP